MARTVAVVVTLVVSQLASGAELVWLDGRRETVNRVVVKDDAVLVSFEGGMRRVSPRQIVKATSDDGKAIAIDRTLRETPLDDVTKAALSQLPAAKADQLLRVQAQLADSMSRTVMDELVRLSKSEKAHVRARAAVTLLLMGLEDPMKAALAVGLADRDKGVRLQVASALFQVSGALRPADIVEGLDDRDRATRATFALALGRLGDKRAIPVLKRSGLKNGDHHIREGAAETLAELGDDSGVAVLVGMLSRSRHPAGASLPERVVVEEKVRVCDHLARLRAQKAVPALQKAARSKDREVVAAAKRALAAIERS